LHKFSVKGSPNNSESEAMKMQCSQCEKILLVGDSCEVAFEDYRLHFLCSKGCKDKWEELRTTREGGATTNSPK